MYHNWADGMVAATNCETSFNHSSSEASCVVSHTFSKVIVVQHNVECLSTVCNMKLGQIIFVYKMLGFHAGDYEECNLLGCDAVWLL
jgi:hypothetical protein